MLLLAFKLFNHDEAAVRAGDRAPDEQQVLVNVHTGDAQALLGHLDRAHVARLAGAFEGAGGIGRAAAGGLAVAGRGAVGRLVAAPAVALDDAGEALALGDAGDGDLVADGEDVGLDLRAFGQGLALIERDFAQRALRLDAVRGEVAPCGRREPMLFDLAEADLGGGVAVAVEVFSCVTTQGPAAMTVTGVTLPLSSKIWVMPSFLPKIALGILSSTAHLAGV